MDKRFIIFVVFLFFIEPQMHATSIVILNNSTTVIVGADSKVGKANRDTLCKIYHTGKMFWAMSGFLNQRATGYDVSTIVKETYRPGMSAKTMLKAFEKNISPGLEAALKNDYRFRPKDFQVVRYHPLEIAFWDFEGGKPVIAHVFYTTTVANDNVSTQIFEEKTVDCRSENCVTSIHATLLGVKDSILEYAKMHPDWGESSLAQTARIFIGLSIEEQPHTVGPPINVVTFKQDGSYRWLSPNNCCHGKLIEAPTLDEAP